MRTSKTRCEDRGLERCRTSPKWRGKVQRAIDSAKDSMPKAATALAASYKRKRRPISPTDFVRESPWQAVGIAAWWVC